MLDGKLSHETCTWVVPSPMTQISLFQPHPCTISHSKLFHNFLPHTLLHNHLFWTMRSIIKKTHTPTHGQKPDHKNKFTWIQNHKHNFGVTYTRSTNINPQFLINAIKSQTQFSIDPSTRSTMCVCMCVCVCVREREREKLNHTQPNQFWIVRHN